MALDENKYPRPLRESGKRVPGGANLSGKINKALEARRKKPRSVMEEPDYVGASDQFAGARKLLGHIQKGANFLTSVDAFKRDLGGSSPYRTDGKGGQFNQDGSKFSDSAVNPVLRSGKPVTKGKQAVSESPRTGNVSLGPEGGKINGRPVGGKSSSGMTVNGKEYNFNDPDRAFAGRGSFAVENTDSWFNDRMSKLKGITEKNTAEYDRQVAHAKRVNAQAPVTRAKMPWDAPADQKQLDRESNERIAKIENQPSEAKPTTLGEGERLFDAQGNQLAEGAPKQAKENAYPEDVMATFKTTTFDEQTGENVTGLDKEKLSSFNQLRQASGIKDSRALQPVWDEAYQNGVDMRDLTALIKNQDSQEYVQAFIDEYGYVPFFLNM